MASTRYAALRKMEIKPFFSAWRLEIVSCLVALISLLATIATLFPHANNPLPQWPFHVSINTLLSIYTAVFKATLISVLSVCVAQLQWTWFSVARPLSDLLSYDEASRDAWGALKWLFYYRLREPLTAFAALLMILSLAIDPFFQQLVIPRDCETPLRETNATIPRTNRIPDQEIFNQWVIEIMASSYTNSSQVSSSLVCPTGNCTFPTQYTTLAYCSSCTDVSDEVSVRVVGSLDTDNFKTEERYITALGSVGAGFETTATLSANRTITNNMPFLSARMDDLFFEQNGSLIGIPGNSEVDLLMSANYFSIRDLDPFTAEKKVGCKTNSSLEDWRCRGYGAAKCSLYRCVRVYEATMKAGRLFESLVAQTNATQGPQLLDTACLSPAQRAYIQSEKYLADQISDDNDSRFIDFWHGNETFVNELWADGCVFSSAVHTLQYALRPLFNPAVTSNDFWSGDGETWALHTGSFSGAPQLLSIFNNGNISFPRISDTFSSIADSMTDWVRTHGDPNYSTPAKGIIWHYATCLEVRWPWIAFPVALYACTIALLGAVTVSTSKSRTPLWKWSPLPWVYYGPAQDFSQDSIPEPEAESMRERAKQHIVVLDGNNTLRIRMVKFVQKPTSDTS